MDRRMLIKNTSVTIEEKKDICPEASVIVDE